MKQRTKKSFSVLLTASIIVCLFACVFYAQASAPLPAFSVSETTQARPGAQVSVTVDVNDNRGFCAGEFTVAYDPDVLTPVSVTKGDAAGQYFVSNIAYDTDKVFFAMIDEQLISTQGTLATVDFTVNEGILLYSGEIGLDVGALFGSVSIGYGFNNVSSTATHGAFHAARRITVPDSDEPTALEELSLASNGSDGMLLVGTKINNLVVESVSANFGSKLTPQFFDSSLNALAAQQRLTTGCIIKIYENSELKQTLTVSAKGDVNGDYGIDGFDAFLAGMAANGMLDENDMGKAASSAADVNGDGSIDQNDFNELEQSGLNP